MLPPPGFLYNPGINPYFETISEYLSLLKLLLIYKISDEQQRFMQSLLNTFPGIRVDTHDPIFGIPGPDFDWSGYSMVLMGQDLGLENESGTSWLQQLQHYGHDMPPVLMLLDKQDVGTVSSALRLGAKNCFSIHDTDSELLVTRIMGAVTRETFRIQAISQPEEASSDVPDPYDDTLPNATPISPDIAGVPSEGDPNLNDSLFDETPTRYANDDHDALRLEIPGYVILREIGRGGMSHVVLARQVDDSREVVLKVMFMNNMNDPSALKRFMQEYNLLSNLNHPHVVKIYERAFAGDFAYIAMEYFPCGDLSSRIRQGVRPAEALEYLRQMASGLGAVHDLNIIHRDIKPGNILFKSDGTLTITDFGVAKSHSDEYEDITITNMIVGTPYYISPEQCGGMKVDQRSDLYSLGVIFYQMLTGERPYTASTVTEIFRAHMVDSIPVLPDYLSKYQPLIDGLLAKDPNERFQTSRELLIGIDWKR